MLGLLRKRRALGPPYASYDYYLEHQGSKMAEMVAAGEEWRRDGKAVAMFRRRFELYELGAPLTILCLGARIGSECKAFGTLGHFAVGIDIAPSPGNEHVMHGDFHRLVFPDRSVDAVYCNCLDHAFEIGAIVKEVARVLKPRGLFLLDAIDGTEEGYVFAGRDCFSWPTARHLADMVAEIGRFEILSERRLDPFGSKQTTQFVLRRP